MAKIYDVGSGVRFYNVSHAVGEGMPNSPDDVMLVQWLLMNHFLRPDKKAMLKDIWDVNVINGICGTHLIEIMRIYQYDANLNVRGASMPLNGRFYPIQTCGGLNKSPVALINLSVQGHFKKFYENPKTDPKVFNDAKAMFDRCLNGDKILAA
jgi:hypothetical protein